MICPSSALADSGKGVRFSVSHRGQPRPAFVIRYRGRVYAYINNCAHVGVELDWQEGEFFDHSKLYLICATHGATYEPESGFCVLGPCRGQSLTALRVMEHDGAVLLLEESETNHV